MTPNPTLEPIEPDTALQLYLEDRRADLADATHRTHRGRLKHFITWCNDTDIDNLNDLSGRDLNKYKIHRASDVKAITLKTYLDTLRVFIRYCEGIDAIPPNTAQKIQSPEIMAPPSSRRICRLYYRGSVWKGGRTPRLCGGRHHNTDARPVRGLP